MQNLHDEKWRKLARRHKGHDDHVRNGVPLYDGCEVCAKSLSDIKEFEEPVSTSTTYIGNPPEPEKKPAPYSRPTIEVTDAEAIAAFEMVHAVRHKESIAKAVRYLKLWLEVKEGDANLAAGYNWDGSYISPPVPPKCPDNGKCMKSWAHWGECKPYKYQAEKRPEKNNIWVPTITEGTNDQLVVDGEIHAADCRCVLACGPYKDAKKSGAIAQQDGEGPHEDSIIGRSPIDRVTDSAPHLLNSYYLFTGKNGCTHTWIGRLVDKVWCFSCDTRPTFNTERIDDPASDPRVIAYEIARRRVGEARK